MSIEVLLKETIYWTFDATNVGYYGKWKDEILFLRLNDFPDEPMYTLVFGLENLDIEEKPIKWIFS